MSKGFTLIELLIAILILALISVMAFRGLDSVLDTRKHVAEESRKWRDISLFFSRLDQDFSNLAHRPIMDASGILEPEFLGKTSYTEKYDANLFISRGGERPERIGYRLDKGKVEELVWSHLDQAPGATPSVYTLLDHVKNFSLRYLALNNNWSPVWPLPGQARPKAVEATLTLDSGEKIVRIFSLL